MSPPGAVAVNMLLSRSVDIWALTRPVAVVAAGEALGAAGAPVVAQAGSGLDLARAVPWAAERVETRPAMRALDDSGDLSTFVAQLERLRVDALVAECFYRGLNGDALWVAVVAAAARDGGRAALVRALVGHALQHLAAAGTLQPTTAAAPSTAPAPPAPGRMQIFVKKLDGETLTVQADSTDTLGVLLARIAAKDADLIVQQFRIVYAGKQLEHDGRSLAGYNMCCEATLHLLLRLRAGGSLGYDASWEELLQAPAAGVGALPPPADGLWSALAEGDQAGWVTGSDGPGGGGLGGMAMAEGGVGDELYAVPVAGQQLGPPQPSWSLDGMATCTSLLDSDSSSDIDWGVDASLGVESTMPVATAPLLEVDTSDSSSGGGRACSGPGTWERRPSVAFAVSSSVWHAGLGPAPVGGGSFDGRCSPPPELVADAPLVASGGASGTAGPPTVRPPPEKTVPVTEETMRLFRESAETVLKLGVAQTEYHSLARQCVDLHGECWTRDYECSDEHHGRTFTITKPAACPKLPHRLPGLAVAIAGAASQGTTAGPARATAVALNTWQRFRQASEAGQRARQSR